MKNIDKILIVGSGYMAKEYLKVIQSMNLLKKTEIFSKSNKNYENIFKLFKLKLGIFKNIKKNNNFSHAIVCVNEDKIFKVVKKLINLKVKNILVEKPGGANLKELKNLNKFAIKNKININVAYNRRYYENIIYLKKIFGREKVLSAQFSFTEWIEKIKLLNYKKNITLNWFHYNSLHLIDLVFYMIGLPKKIFSKSEGNDKKFNKTLFTGSGISKKNIYFSYHSNWKSAGRWSIELFTNKCKYILSPLEKLQVQKKNELNVNTIKFTTKFDHKFKPGIYIITKKFFENKKILPYKDYIEIFKLYNIIFRGN